MKHQAGISLIEVLVAMLVMTLALLGAAALQLNALKYTGSSQLRTQASFAAYDIMERIRANNAVNYAVANFSALPTTGSLTDPRTQDLFDFRTNLLALNVTTVSITLVNNVYTVTINWDDTRAAGLRTVNNGDAGGPTTQTFVLTSRVIAPPTASATTQ